MKAKVKFYSEEYIKENFYLDDRGVAYDSDSWENVSVETLWCWVSDAGFEGEITVEELSRFHPFCELLNPSDFINFG